ncbi:MAG TPA: hypothetical protein VMB21_20100 [Candidatus Limnocylindria bacterium]|nr:hypothetical protein [Candidatus Limnocylindria bacterium]
MSGRWYSLAVGSLLSLLGMLGSRAQPIAIPIPNGSFESPATPYVSTFIDAWQETPKPADYMEGGGFTWDQLTGLFVNTQPGAADHVGNLDGRQAAYLFAVPGTGWFQDHDSVDWHNQPPTHALAARFEVGTAYDLSFGVIAGGGNMLEGVSFEAALYYRDAATNMVTVAATNVVYTHDVFPVDDLGRPIRTNLTYFRLRLPVVMTNDLWAGQYLGLRFLSNVSPDLQGGYWDLDDVRLVAIPPPVFALGFSLTGTDLRLAWPSVMGYRYLVKVSEDLRTWSDDGVPQSGTGNELSQAVPLDAHPNAAFRVEATPEP